MTKKNWYDVRDFEEILDRVLRMVLNQGGSYYHDYLYETNPNSTALFTDVVVPLMIVNNNQLIELLDIVKMDGYITYELRENGEVDNIYLTQKGLYFIGLNGEGGYVRQLERKNRAELRINRQAKLILFLTFVLAAGTTVSAVFYAIEIYKFLFSLHHQHG